MLARTFVCGAIFSLLLSGCGGEGSSDATGPKQAYTQLEKLLTNGNGSACAHMTGSYQNKLAASVQQFSADCPAVVKEVGNGLRADPDLKTTSISDVSVKGETATLIARSTYEGRVVRTKAWLKRNANGDWVLDRDQELDDVAPSAPLAAYREYFTAFSKGNGKKACALSTGAGQARMAESTTSGEGPGACAGAVPFIATSVHKLSPPDIVGGATKGAEAKLYALQSTGGNSWAFREIEMKRVAGKWLFNASRDLGVAPSKKTQGGPVA